eukprot:scaffold243779_cov23-Tisochrysis_lutea.AAC.2
MYNGGYAPSYTPPAYRVLHDHTQSNHACALFCAAPCSLFITDTGGYTPSYVYRLLTEYYSREDYL